MKYPRIHQKIFNEPWAITETGYDAIRQTFLSYSKNSVEQAQDSKSLSSLASVANTPAVAIIPISGIIGKRLSSLETLCGGCDLDAIHDALYETLADPTVETIILHADTPGGTVTGTPELARAIFGAAQNSSKQIIGYTDTLCCSAGYWLLSQCQALYAAPSASVGSIGVIITLLNQVKKDAADGVSYTTIKSGPYKDLGNPHRAMTDDEQAHLQTQVDQLAQQFFQTVQAARPEVDAEGLGAKVLTGADAQLAGLIDGQYDTLNDLLNDL